MTSLRVVAGYIGTHQIDVPEAGSWSAEAGTLRVKDRTGEVVRVVFDVKSVVVL